VAAAHLAVLPTHYKTSLAAEDNNRQHLFLFIYYLALYTSLSKSKQ
jgi:hypothetical protein